MIPKTAMFITMLVTTYGLIYGVIGCETTREKDSQAPKKEAVAPQQAEVLDTTPFPKDAVQVSQQLIYPCGETIMCPQFFSGADLGCKAFFDQGRTFIVDQKGNNSCALGVLHQKICQAHLDPVAADIVCFRTK